MPTPQAKSYISASNRAWLMKAGTGLALALIFGFVAWAWQLGLSVEHALLKLKSTVTQIHMEPEMVEVKPGAFRMGNVGGVGDEFEQPAHDVMIQKPFKLGKYEATFDQYDRFAVATGKPLPQDQGWGRGRRPVVNVSWEEARDFAGWLSKQSGKRYRLPSEAEWEYAARSGGKDEIWAGTKNETELKEYAWYYSMNSGGKTQEIGGKKPNGLGVHDMSGNVWEWVEDCWHASYTDAPSDGRAWKEETGGQCGQRVTRGGSWGSYPVNLRSSYRFWGIAGSRSDVIGFRLAQDLP